MKSYLSLFLVIFCVSFGNLHAQQTAVNYEQLSKFENALDLYNNYQFKAASVAFNNLIEAGLDGVLESDSHYYLANCAIRLNKVDGEQLIFDFVNSYPESNKASYAFVDVANFKFANGKYKEALAWYKKVNQNMLYGDEREQYYFNYAYTLYITGNSKQAKRYFTRVKDSQLYGEQAVYYIGYMAYQGDDYDTAETFFNQIKENEAYREELTYFQADLNFKKGRFELAIELAKAQLEKNNRSEVSELSKIIGESYFNLSKYVEALPYLKAYKGKNRKWNHIDYYQLGYCYYKTADYESAISEFNKIINGKDDVAQNAYYHLGESYLKQDQKSQALNAFRNACQMQFSEAIKSDAFLNYAKLSYEIGNAYEPVSNVLLNYLNTYPNSVSSAEIESLLISSYIASKDYPNAMALLENIERSDSQNNAYQKAAFLHGVDLYNSNDFKNAKMFFLKSIKSNDKSKLATRSLFWLGDAYYKLSEYNLAESSYKSVLESKYFKTLSDYQIVAYNLGYVYFKTKAYDQAIVYFTEWLMHYIGNDDLLINDTSIRLADCYFVSSNYDKALEFYKKGIDIGKSEQDYAEFQMAMSYGFMGKSSEKINRLIRFISKYKSSPLVDDALYDIANTYNKKSEFKKAMTYYDLLLEDYPQSEFASRAILRQGLTYYNQNQTSQALVKLKKLAEQFPESAEAQQAVSTVKLIYIDQGKVEAYASWVKTLNYIEVTDNELDNAAYEAAEKQYLDGNTKMAIKQFNKYLSTYLNGVHSLKAHYYLSELYLNTDLPSNAIPHLEYVIDASDSKYTEQSLLELAQIRLDNSEWEQAIPLLKTLEQESSNTVNGLYALSNLMQAYYKAEHFKEAVLMANKVLSQSRLDQTIKEDAHLILAKTFLTSSDFESSKTHYETLVSSVRPVVAVEASYYLAYFEYEAKAYEASNSRIQNLIKSFPNQKYYCSKSLLLMARNFDALKDAFQSTYILENVIKNFSSYDEVVSEAQALLSQIKENEAKTNSSIEIED